MVKRLLPSRDSEKGLKIIEAYLMGDIDTALKLSELANEGSLNRAMRDVYGVYRSRDWRSKERVKPEKELPPIWKERKSKPLQEQLQIFKQMDDLVAFHQKTPTEITIEIPTDKPIALTDLADIHLGMFGVDYDAFERDIALIESEPGLYCEIGGDGYQNIIQPGKMGSSHNQIPIAVQKGAFVLTLKQLKHKIKAVRTGNHNYWTALADGEDWDAEIARKLKLVYLKHYAKIYWKVGNQVYPELALHKGRYNSSFNLTHTCKQYQRLYAPDARIITVEHQHIAAMEQYRYNDKECVAIRTGTYAVYDDYAQQNGFFGAHVSNPTVVLFPNEDKLVAFKDIWDAVVYLRAVRQ
jgi:hypothetical protein